MADHIKPVRRTNYLYYLLPVLAVLILILLINGYFQVKQIRERLFLIMETEGQLLIRGLETGAANLFRQLDSGRPFPAETALPEVTPDVELINWEEILIERLVDLGLRLDQEAARHPEDPDHWKGLVAAEGLEKVSLAKDDPADPVYRELGRHYGNSPFWKAFRTGRSRLFVGRPEPGESGPYRLLIALSRRFGSGFWVIGVSPQQYQELIRQIMVQGLVDEFSDKGNLAYLEIRDRRGRPLVRLGPEGRETPNSVLWTKRLAGREYPVVWIKRDKGEFLEINRDFDPGGQRLGTIRLGLSLKMISSIIDQSRRQVLVMTLGFLGLGIFSIVLVFRLQNRHFRKIGELEERMRLQEELSAMGQLAAGVAHEIKNPLNAIGLVVQRLQKEFPCTDPASRPDYERFTQIIRDEISRVNHIIEQFLFVARPYQAGREEQSLGQLLDYVLALLEEEFKEKGIILERSGGPEPPPVPGDRFQLTQAFLNLLNNAVEAMPGGGVLRVSLRDLRDSGEVEVRLEDSGTGIAPENLQRVFAHYFTTKEKGVGLGLAITQKIIQGHGGSLRIESELNRGTTVILRLPRRISKNVTA